MLKNVLKMLSALLIAGTTIAAHADTAWPQRPVRLIVPFPAGGNVDAYARVFAPALASALHATVVIENKPGATGAIGVDYVARSEPDGYTVLLGNITSIVGTAVLGSGSAKDAMQHLAPVCTLVDSEVVMLANKQSGIKSLDDLKAMAQKGGAKQLTFGSSGSGSISHLAMMQVMDYLHLPATHVPYKGNGQFLIDLLSGQIQLGMVDLTNSRQYIDAGKVVPLLVTGKTRLPELPAVPTTGELGLTTPDFSAWSGLFLPKGTPEAIVSKLGAASHKAMSSPAVQSYSSQNGNKPAYRDAKQTLALVQAGMKDWGNFVKTDLIASSLAH